MTENPLPASPGPLVNMYDVALLDLDGVVYVGSDAVPGAPEIIATATAAGMRFGYVTNNASRSPSQVGDHLRKLGITATDEEVITSSQAASRVLAERLPAGSPVLIIGTSALAAEVGGVGLQPVWSAADEPLGVVQGYSPEMSWAMLAEACVAIRAGAFWVATNTDATLPSPRGPLPGNGSFVQIVSDTTGAVPVVAGKPEPAMHAECVLRTGAVAPLVVGDRLDTDIEGAHRAGVPSLLVLTGLAQPADLLAARVGRRPTYLAADLDGLLIRHPGVDRTFRGVRCGDWQVTHLGEELLLSAVNSHGGATAADSAVYSHGDCDALRALAIMAWEHGITRTAAGDQAAVARLTRLGLPAGLTSRCPETQRSDLDAKKGWTVVRDAFATVAGIVKGVAQDVLRGSRRALDATVTGIRARAPEGRGRSRRKGRGSPTGIQSATAAGTPSRAARPPVSAPRSADEPVGPAAASPVAAETTEGAAPATNAVAPSAKKGAQAGKTTAKKVAPAKKTTAKKTTAKKAAAKKAAPAEKGTVENVVPAKKTTAKKAAPGTSAASQTAADGDSGAVAR